MDIKFVRPTHNHKPMLEAFKFAHSDELFLHGASGLERMPLDEWLNKLSNQEQNKHLPDGYVPSTTFMVLNQDEIIGFVNIRHYLNEQLLKSYGHVGYMVHKAHRQKGYGKAMLQFAMHYAKTTLQLNSLLIACDFDNIGSKRLIERCGGVITTENFALDKAPYLQYRIYLS